MQVYQPIIYLAILFGIVSFFWRLTKAGRDADTVEIGNALAAFVAFVAALMILPPIAGLLAHLAFEEIAPGFVGLAGDNLEESLSRLEVDFQSGDSGIPVFLSLILLIAAVFAGAFTQLLLIFVHIMLYGVVALTPFAFAIQIAGKNYEGTFLDKCVGSFFGLLLIPIALGGITLIGVSLAVNGEEFEPLILSFTLLFAGPFLSVILYKAVTAQNLKVPPVGSYISGYVGEKVRDRLP